MVGGVGHACILVPSEARGIKSGSCEPSGLGAGNQTQHQALLTTESSVQAFIIVVVVVVSGGAGTGSRVAQTDL